MYITDTSLYVVWHVQTAAMCISLVLCRLACLNGSDVYITYTSLLHWLACLQRSSLVYDRHAVIMLAAMFKQQRCVYHGTSLLCWLACVHHSGVYITDTSLSCRHRCVYGIDACSQELAEMIVDNSDMYFDWQACEFYRINH